MGCRSAMAFVVQQHMQSQVRSFPWSYSVNLLTAMVWRIHLLTRAPLSCLKGPRRHPWQQKSALFCSFLHLVPRSSNRGGLDVTPG
eukprot:2856925-Pyramimonas_sp.AAC.1